MSERASRQAGREAGRQAGEEDHEKRRGKAVIILRIMKNDEDKKKDSVEDNEIDDLLKK